MYSQKYVTVLSCALHDSASGHDNHEKCVVTDSGIGMQDQH